MSKVFGKIKSVVGYIIKDQRYSKAETDYLFLCNVRSSVYVAIVIALLEIWMLIQVMTGEISQDGTRPVMWVIEHTVSYIVLLLTSVMMLLYSVFYLKGLTSNKLFGYIIKIFFTFIALGFGIYISYRSYDKSGQVFAFVTMIGFCLCLFVWRPVNSFLILTGSFGLYLYLQNKREPLSYSICVNSFTAWIVFLMATINIHHQRRIEAQKDENLEKINQYLQQKSIVDELTNLPNLSYFRSKTIEMLKDNNIDISDYRFVFMDVENFKNYNEKYGFRAGNNFLLTIGQIVQDCFKGDIVARFSDDHYIAFAPISGLTDKIDKVKNAISEQENSIKLGLKTGLYMPTDRMIPPSIALDHARYACESIKKHYGIDIQEYSETMDGEFNRKQYIINNIDNAVIKGYIKIYYQPVVWAENSKLCGAEALARWNDPEFGFLPPGEFVPILEEYQLIHKLDMYVMEEVCRTIGDAYKNKEPIIPISINFSRLDFELADPVSELNRCIEQYGITKEDIHVEVTESALVDTDQKIKTALNEFREQGFSLWLDDFGSGYSGLNVLKDYNFDMMKIDMKFLSKFSENVKTRPILSGVVEIAKSIGMQTLTEGVETREMSDFLRSIGCQRLQGYLYGKPMPRDELLAKIHAGEYDVSDLKTV
ncbi:MAG: EAL domain-containing protein [Spirochaetales bacterium]|nr:EAL domain-containing protein [Spirochaetales bacterium]